MKKNVLLFLCLVFTLNIATSQSKLEKKKLKKERLEAEYKETKDIIESGKFEFEAAWAFPLSGDITRLNLSGGNNVFVGNRVNLSGNSNYVKLNSEDAKIFLPYFGRAFRVVAASRAGGGLEFEGSIEKYNVKYKDDKHKIEIKFTTKDTNDLLQYHFVITSKSNATLNVNSSNRQSIRYTGEIKPLKEKKE